MSEKKLREASQRFAARDLAGTERLCGEILRQAPRHPEALHLLGIVRLVQGRPADAADLIARALASDPRNAAALENLGLAQLAGGDCAAAETSFGKALGQGARHAMLHMRLGLALGGQGKHAEAIASLRNAAQAAPRDPDIQLNLGNALAESGQADEAIACYRQVLVLQPGHVDARFNAGTLLRRMGRLEEAAAEYDAVLAKAPDYVDAHVNLGLVRAEQGRPDEAIASYQRALAIDPRHAGARNNLGNAYIATGQRDEAVQCFAAVLAVVADHPDANANLAAIRIEEGRLADAESLYERALRSSPRDAEIRRSLARLLMRKGSAAQAIPHLQRALELRPEQPEILKDLASAYSQCGNFPQAENHYRQALAADPKNAEVNYSLAEALKVQGRLAEAAEHDERALALQPDLHAALGSLVHLRQHMCAWDGIETLWARLRSAAIGKAGSGISPFSILSQPSTAEEQLQCARAWAELRCAPLRRIRERLNFDFSGRSRVRDRLRVGYLSWDYHQHATAYLIAELFALHDARRFEIFAYDYGPDDASPIRERIVGSCEHFVTLEGASHVAVAERIHQDGIDILVDLKGYTLAARTEIMALRPAPIQVSWLGYPGTMGADFIDYLIADRITVPEGSERHYSERVWRLPGCYQINDRHREIAQVTPTRDACGLPDEGFVFCCFNLSYKILPDTFAVWTDIMQAVPGSVLWLLETNSWAAGNLRRAAAAAGIDPARIVFAPRRPLPEHLARYRVADLALDTFPYTSHTTASDALWAGCPLVTRAGATFASRVAASLLHNAGLPQLVVETNEDYQRLVVHLATHREELAALRRLVHEKRATCPLFDTPRFVAGLERAYEDMFSRLGTY